MAFNLEKGSKFSLDKGIQRVQVGLGWSAADNYDLDACAFGLKHDQSGKPRFYDSQNYSHVVFFGNKGQLKKGNAGAFGTFDDSILHHGDSLTGEADGDDEIIDIDFTKLPDAIDEVSILVTIYKPQERGHSFKGVKDSYIKVRDIEGREELCSFQLKENFPDSTSVQVGSFLKENGTWSFQAVGAGFNKTLDQILEVYM